MAGNSLREVTIPRFALRAEEAAASLAISTSLFKAWVSDGRMPKGRKIGGVMLWDTEKVRAAWSRLSEDGESQDDDENPFDGMVA
ncbi:DNA-binding protein [Martelella lutilitoris]|uniref:DNA-binding protein n=1 Tax=Martelella lutilitoris TaxID=2583532 RepID=A0A5C4JS09_9HYPH|nr:DNA-binding protein [Martelella lutilitoris]TNB48057.1 DNA-binding protein [Martelella lutilitoris]